MANAKLDAMMKKIQGLLDTADHPNTAQAMADTYRAKAEQLMAKYRIEESTLIQSGALAGEAIRPTSKKVVVCPAGSDYYIVYFRLMHYIAQHAGLRMQHDWGYVGDSGYSLVVALVGYESDIRFAEALFTNARLVFSDRMEPKKRDDLSDEDNVYRLRSSGMERARVGVVMGWGGEGTNGPVKVTRLYKKACEARGEEPVLTGKGVGMKAFRETYAESFTTEFYSMLRRARNSADTGGAELVLAGRKDAVNEAFYEMYPDQRPVKVAGEIGYTDTRTEKQRARDETRAMREFAKQTQRRYSAAGLAGAQAGQKAAREVDVSARKPTGRIEG